MEGEGSDGRGVLLWSAVFGELVHAAFVGSADEVEDGPGEGIESGGGGGERELVGDAAGFEDGEEVVMAGAKELVGLAAVAGFTADGEEKAVEILLVAPELHANGDGGGEAVADASGGANACVGDGLELGDGEMDGGGVDVFFGLEVEIERAFGDMGGCGDIFDAGGGESLFAEDFDGCGEDLLTAQIGEDLLAGEYAGGGGGAHGIKLACLMGRMQERFG